MAIQPDIDPRESDVSERTGHTRRSLRQAGRDAEELVRDRAEDVRRQSRDYADAAGRQLEGVQRRVSDKLREKPVTTTLALLGAALLVGAMFAARSPGAVKRAAENVRREL